MQTIIGIATIKGRECELEKTLQSLDGQADLILIYDNDKEGVDLTDNGKFIGLESQTEPVYYFTCDDDLIYPSDYVQKLKAYVDKVGCIVTCHGRRLLGLDRSYYYGHATFRFNTTEHYAGRLDVPGTGVMCFRTDYFNPMGLHLAENKRMSDLVFALEAAKQNKEIRLMPHEGGWIRQQRVTHSIHNTERLRERVQIEIANEIYSLLHNE